MFNRRDIPLDTQLNNEQLANMLVAEAIEQLQQLTQLSQADCETLVEKQFANNKTHGAIKQPIIEQRETDFICGLFN
ncbi:hypothetical protein ACFSJY_16340 [Thalassotalea euphylliae]|uniref:hypothetical protein n=1 Tax=Thalassotalea euphylliae TaxID=1655234 RepID=UPI00363DF85C